MTHLLHRATRVGLCALLLTSLGVGLVAPLPAAAQTAPPYAGTIGIDPDIVLPTDPTVYASATYTGRGTRTVYDRRVNNWVTIDAYLYRLTFSDGSTIEAQINPEFGSEQAGLAQAEYYGPLIGQLPAVLRRDIDALWIHLGVQPFGGGNRSILIHTGQAAAYVSQGILEETLIHEAAHTSLDADHAAATGWTAAQRADPTFISTYARDNPTREDVAESFVPYVAARYRSDRITPAMRNTITGAIPNRIAYLDAQNFDMSPVGGGVSSEEEPGIPGLTFSVVPNPARSSAIVRLTLDRPRAVRVDVLDLLGRTVAEVAAGHSPAGEWTYTLDASGLAGGVYVCRVSADGVVLTRRISVLR